MASRGAPRRMWVLMATVFVDMVGVLMVLPLLPYYATRFEATGWSIGLLTSTFAAAQLCSAPLWGRLSDRYGRRPVILAGLLVSAGGYLFFGFSEALWMLFATRVLQGLGAGTIGVVQAYVSDVVGPEGRAKALGWLTAAASAGVTLGPIIGSQMSEHFGRSAPGLLAAGLCLANVTFAGFLLRESSDRSARKRRPLLAAVAEVLRHPSHPASALIWLYTVGMMAFMAMNGILGLYLKEHFGVAESEIGWFYTYVGGISVLMRAVVLGAVLDRLGEPRAMRAGAAAMALGFLLMPLAPTIAVFLACAALIPIGTALFFPTSTSILSQRSPQEELGQMLGVQQSFRGIAGILGPAWAGAAYDYLGALLGLGAPFFISAVLMSVAVAFTARVAASGTD